MNVLFFYLVFSSEVFLLEKLKRLKTIGRDIFFSKSESFDKNKVSNVSVVKSNIKDERIDKKLLPKIVDKPFSAKFYKLTKTQNDGGEIFVKICVNLSLISSHADTSFRNESNSKL